MHAAEKSHQDATDHDVVEVGDDEVGVGDVNVDAERGQEQSGQSADGEETDEAEGVEHRRGVGNRAAVESGGPVKDL